MSDLNFNMNQGGQNGPTPAKSATTNQQQQNQQMQQMMGSFYNQSAPAQMTPTTQNQNGQGQNNLMPNAGGLAQLAGLLGGNSTPNNGSQMPPNQSQNQTTQMLLLELLRQNSINQMGQNGTPQNTSNPNLFSPSSNNNGLNVGQNLQGMMSAADQNPNNQSLYGQGFLGAQQLLASQSSITGTSSALQNGVPGMAPQAFQTHDGTSTQPREPFFAMGATGNTSGPQQPTFQPPVFTQQDLNASQAQIQAPKGQEQEAVNLMQNLPQQNNSNNVGGPNYSSNLNQIFQNLNNYQQMIDQLETGSAPLNQNIQNQATPQNLRAIDDPLNQSQMSKAGPSNFSNKSPIDHGKGANEGQNKNESDQIRKVDQNSNYDGLQVDFSGPANTNSNQVTFPSSQQNNSHAQTSNTNHILQRQNFFGGENQDPTTTTETASQEQQHAIQQKSMQQEEYNTLLQQTPTTNHNKRNENNVLQQSMVIFEDEEATRELTQSSNNFRGQNPQNGAISAYGGQREQHPTRQEEQSHAAQNQPKVFNFYENQPRQQNSLNQDSHSGSQLLAQDQQTTMWPSQQNNAQNQSNEDAADGGVSWISSQQNNNQQRQQKEQMSGNLERGSFEQDSGQASESMNQRQFQMQQMQGQNQQSNLSKNPVNIDDIPIKAAKTFEQLLEEKLKDSTEQAIANGSSGQDTTQKSSSFDPNAPKPKREFLKRKKPAYVPPNPSQPPKKSYKYYADAVVNGSKSGGENVEKPSVKSHQNRASSRQENDFSTNPDSNSRRTLNSASNQQNRRAQTAHPSRSSAQDSEAQKRVAFGQGGTFGGPRKQPDFNNEMPSGPFGNTFAGAGETTKESEISGGSKPVQKRPFLKSGTGKLASTINNNNTNNQGSSVQQPQPQRVDNLKSPNNNQNNLRSQKGNQSSNMAMNNNYQSIDEFQKLEQECNDRDYFRGQSKQQTSSSTGNGMNNQLRRKKKLFDDSDDSDDQQNDEAQNADAFEQKNNDDQEESGSHYRNQRQLQRIEEESGRGGEEQNHQQQSDQRSNLVKQMFYKENPLHKMRPGTAKQSNSAATNPAAQSDPNQQIMMATNPQMDQLLAKKSQQLEKEIERYHSENERLAAMKSNYEQMTRKLRIDQRELEAQRKKAHEEVEKLKEDEIVKLRKEKRQLEQRQKNFSLNAQSAKREREEIDSLMREFNKYKADAELKQKKQASQIERLTKVNNEIKQKNRELTEDLRALDQQRILLERSVNRPAPTGTGISANSTPGSSNYANKAQAASRYQFSSISNNQQALPLNSNNNIGQGLSRQLGMLSNNQAEDHRQQRQYVDEHEEQDDDQQQHDDEDNDNAQYGDENQYEQHNGKYHYQDGAANNYQVVEEEDQEYVDEDEDEDSDQHAPPNHAIETTNQAGNTRQSEQEVEEDFGLHFPGEYHAKTVAHQKVVEQYVGTDGKIQRVYESGKKEVIFNNGVKRESHPDGYTIVYFNNADVKQTFPDGKIVYYFAEAKTTQTTFADKLQVFKFQNNQIEKHFPDKTKEIIFPDGTIKCIFEDGEEESIFPDGTIQKIEKSGVKAIEFANGQKDILYPDGVRVREFPDGKVRKTYPDGRTEVNTK